MHRINVAQCERGIRLSKNDRSLIPSDCTNVTMKLQSPARIVELPSKFEI